jgi:hypothetical protein
LSLSKYPATASVASFPFRIFFFFSAGVTVSLSKAKTISWKDFTKSEDKEIVDQIA